MPRLLALAALLVAALVAPTATGAVSPDAPDTYERIREAVSAGRLGQGRGLLLGLRAARGTGGVPPALRGAGEIEPGVLMADVASALPRLSVRDRRALLPFLVPPSYRESAWFAGSGARAVRVRREAGARAQENADCARLGAVTRGVWTAVPAGGATVYYPTARPAFRSAARVYARELRRTILPALTGAFRAPLATSAQGCDPTGGRGLDVYVVAPAAVRGFQGDAVAVTGAGGTPLPTPGACARFATFLLVPPGAGKAVLAHEVMHAVQFAYGWCERSPALVEGSAAWAEDLVYPTGQSEHRYPRAITTPFLSLLDDAGDNEYGSWAFWYGLGRRAGDSRAARAARVAALFAALERQGATLASAFEASQPGGWRSAWERYAVERWNGEPIGSAGFPVAAAYRSWDRLPLTPAGVQQTPVTLAGARRAEATFQTSRREPLATWFQDVRVDDPKVRRLTVVNPLADDGALVQAMVQRRDGSWRLEDWSSRGEATFCRDRADEDVTRIVLAVSNPSPSGGALPAATFTVRSRDRCGVPVLYRGTFTSTWYLADGGVLLRATGDVVFRLQPGLLTTAGSLWWYRLESGSASWTTSYTSPVTGCVFQGSGVADLMQAAWRDLSIEDTSEPGNPHAAQVPSPEPLPWYVALDVEYDVAHQIEVTRTCPGTDPEQTTIGGRMLKAGFRDWTVGTPPRLLQKAGDAWLLDGSHTGPEGAGTSATYTWHLVGEP